MQYFLVAMVGIMINLFVNFIKLGFLIIGRLFMLIIELISLIFKKSKK